MSALRKKLRADLLERKGQFAAIALMAFLGVTLFVASYDSFRNLEASYEKTFTDFRFANLTVEGGRVEEFAAAARAAPGVLSVQTRTVGELPLRIADHKLVGRIVSIPAGEQPLVNQVKVLAGAYPESGHRRVLVEQHLADHYRLDPGDHLEALGPGGWTGLEVAGVASSPEYIWPARSRQDILTSPQNFGVIFVTAAEAQELLSRGVNQTAVYYEPAADRDALNQQLAKVADRLDADDWFTREQQPSNAVLSEDLKGFEELSGFFPALFLLAGGMAAYVLITRLVQSQRPEIGILRAEGYRRRQILLHYLGHGAVPGLLGALPGTLAGLSLAAATTRLYTSVISVPVRIVQIRPSTLLTGLAIGLGASLLAAAAPAIEASRIPPAEAMRGSPDRNVRFRRSRTPLGSLFGRLPVRWKVVVRGPVRNLRRSLYTMTGVVLAMVLILVSWGMIDTIDILLDRQFVQIERQDAVALLSTPGNLSGLAEVPGVAAVEPAIVAPVVLGAGDQVYGTRLTALRPGTRMHRFLRDDTRLELPEDGLLVGGELADQLDVQQGDRISVAVPELGVDLEETIAGFVDEPLGTPAYISLPRLQELAGRPLPPTTALLSFEPGAPSADVGERLTSLPVVAALEDSGAMFESIRSFMGLFYAFVGVMLAFGAAMAFALIYASMSAGIAERSREMASLLAEGMHRRQIARLITAENLLVVTAGIGPGLVAGYLVSALAMSSYSSDLFSFDLHMRPSTLVLAPVLIVLVALASQRPGLRAIARLDIAEVVRQRSL